MNGVIVNKGNKKFVGALEVFEQQIDAAKDCFDIFMDKDHLYQSPILLGECQSGKTGSAVILIKMFINWCEYRGIRREDREILFSINSSNNDLLKQLNLRLLQSGLTDEVFDFHHSYYRKHNLSDNKIKARLFIVDECHIALCDGREESLKPYEKFLYNCGISLGKHRNYWRDKNNFVLQISATPNTQLIYNELFNEMYGDSGPFKFVYLKNADSYLSVTHMLDKGRIEQSYKLFSTAKEAKNEATPWFSERLFEFYNMTKSEYGILLIRMTGNNNVHNLMKFIKKNYPDHFEIRDYNSKNKNIPDISDELSITLARPLIAIVRGSLREGKTLDSTKYIKMIIDTPDTVSSTVVQGLLGRCCGYPISGHNRHDDTFRIYCDVEEVRDHVKMLENLRQGKSPSSIASSRYNDSSLNKTKFNYMVDILPFDSADKLISVRKQNLENYADSEEYCEILTRQHREDYLNGSTTDDCDTYVASKISKLKSITAQHTNRKSKLVNELLESFESSYYDEEINSFRVNRGAKVTKHLNYEILDGSLPEHAEEYTKLFKILNQHLNLDINQKYVIFYNEGMFQSSTSEITTDKLKSSIFKKSITV